MNNEILTKEEFRTLKGLLKYWEEARKKKDFNSLRKETYLISQMFSPKILLIIEKYLEITSLKKDEETPLKEDEEKLLKEVLKKEEEKLLKEDEEKTFFLNRINDVLTIIELNNLKLDPTKIEQYTLKNIKNEKKIHRHRRKEFITADKKMKTDAGLFF